MFSPWNNGSAILHVYLFFVSLSVPCSALGGSDFILRKEKPACPAGPYCQTEWISKFGIMFNTDVHPLEPQADTTDIDPSEFETVSLASWSRLSVDLAKKKKQKVTLSADSRGHVEIMDLKAHSQEESSTTIHAAHYLRSMRNASTTQTVYVITSALPAFMEAVFPNLTKPFVLVTGHAVASVPADVFTDQEFQAFIESPKIVHWFGQNGCSDHPKFTRIPNGLDYHTLAAKSTDWGPQATPQQQETELNQSTTGAPPFLQKKDQVLTAFSMSNPWRSTVLSMLQSSKFAYAPSASSRRAYWETMARMKYVASPKGVGYDCHRTWEALILGAVPLVDDTCMNKLYDDHNLHVKSESQQSWQELGQLSDPQQLLEHGGQPTQDAPALKLHYWVDLINAAKR